ncbi:hypothetical protein NP493_1330g01003 [Ridgeia piscesae]|uniref:VWFD domain-containing protein n=1 Tax=Ridgeia piscesae TaxID=27915 RepID=A0AAD9NGE1_RIDPI|nr:hypothetical protein NP493_1330g01003 [Ridgeia piscesae]
MVVTWSGMLPRMYYSPWYDSLVIAYDPSRYQTFAMYHYMDMGWDNEYTLRRSMIGYFSYRYSQERSRQLAPSMKRTAFRMQQRKGNTDGRGSHASLIHRRWRRLHEIYDVQPKRWCCQFSDACEYFTYLRPIDYCWGYIPPFLGWFYGDPHIRTLDGFQYTFNGLGEYTLVETTHDNFTLQGRTAKARDVNGTETDATVFSAFAARDVDSDTVHIGMNAKREGLGIFVDGVDMTDWFNAANLTDDKEFDNVTLTKTNVTQIEVSYKSGFSLTIGVSARQLDITVGAPDKFKNHTKGLMGVFNGDPTDDLLPPGENAVALSNSSSEKTIFYQFGRILAVDSLFYYASGERYSTFAHKEFKPLFLEDVLKNMTAAERAKAQATCGENKECLFDFAVTGMSTLLNIVHTLCFI